MAETAKLWVLADNNTLIDRYFLGEPAASYYLEIDGLRILLDTGYSDVFLQNAEKLGLDLGRLTHIVLSHGHNDPPNGLALLAERFDLSGVRLIAHPRCLLPRWYGGEYIGPPADGAISAACDYRPSKAPVWLSENCVFLGEIPAVHDFEQRRPLGRVLLDGEEQPDLLADDTALACRTPEGLFILTGCSHSGICNIVSHAQAVCGEPRIAGILGGFHLPRANSRVEKTASFLASLRPGVLYPCHCVSLAAKLELAKVLPVQEVGCGMCVSF